MYIRGRISFKILGEGTFIFIQCLFLHSKVLHLLSSLFLNTTIVFAIITVTIMKYIKHLFSLLLLPSDFHLSIYWCSNFLLISNSISTLFLSLPKLFIINFVDFSSLSVCHIPFPATFWLSQLTATTGGEFKSVNSSGIGYPYRSTPISKLFMGKMLLFCCVSDPLSFSVRSFFSYPKWLP